MSDRPKMSKAEATAFLKNYILAYSMWGKTMRNGALVWFDTGEPCDEEGTKRHFEKVADLLRQLDEMGKEK